MIFYSLVTRMHTISRMIFYSLVTRKHTISYMIFYSLVTRLHIISCMIFYNLVTPMHTISYMIFYSLVTPIMYNIDFCSLDITLITNHLIIAYDEYHLQTPPTSDNWMRGFGAGLRRGSAAGVAAGACTFFAMYAASHWWA